MFIQDDGQAWRDQVDRHRQADRYFEKETRFDILKARKAHFRAWDHQLMQEAYPFTVSPRPRQGSVGLHCAGDRASRAGEPLESLAPNANRTPARYNGGSGTRCASSGRAGCPRIGRIG